MLPYNTIANTNHREVTDGDSLYHLQQHMGLSTFMPTQQVQPNGQTSGIPPSRVHTSGPSLPCPPNEEHLGPSMRSIDWRTPTLCHLNKCRPGWTWAWKYYSRLPYGDAGRIDGQNATNNNCSSSSPRRHLPSWRSHLKTLRSAGAAADVIAISAPDDRFHLGYRNDNGSSCIHND